MSCVDGGFLTLARVSRSRTSCGQTHSGQSAFGQPDNLSLSSRINARIETLMFSLRLLLLRLDDIRFDPTDIRFGIFANLQNVSDHASKEFPRLIQNISGRHFSILSSCFASKESRRINHELVVHAAFIGFAATNSRFVAERLPSITGLHCYNKTPN